MRKEARREKKQARRENQQQEKRGPGPSLPAAHFPPPTQAAGGHLYTCARSTPSFSSSCPSCSASERRAFALRVWAKGLIQKPLSVTGLSLPSHVAPYSQGRHSRPAATCSGSHAQPYAYAQIQQTDPTDKKHRQKDKPRHAHLGQLLGHEPGGLGRRHQRVCAWRTGHTRILRPVVRVEEDVASGALVEAQLRAPLHPL